jgi:hypothetical protein
LRAFKIRIEPTHERFAYSTGGNIAA